MTTTPASASKPSQPSKVVPATWKPVAAGILMMIAGITAIVGETIYLASGDLGVFEGIPIVESSASLNGILFATGAIAIVAGVFAILRRIWWLVIVGVVFSMFFTIWPVLVVGLISIALIAMSRREFKRTKIG